MPPNESEFVEYCGGRFIYSEHRNHYLLSVWQTPNGRCTPRITTSEGYTQDLPTRGSLTEAVTQLSQTVNRYITEDREEMARDAKR